ncbi:MAG: hypothetical protein ACLGIF_10580 [Actinomycetes bacterium]
MFELISVAAVVFWCVALPLRAAGRLGPRRRARHRPLAEKTAAVRTLASEPAFSAAAEVPPVVPPVLVLAGSGSR